MLVAGVTWKVMLSEVQAGLAMVVVDVDTVTALLERKVMVEMVYGE